MRTTELADGVFLLAAAPLLNVVAIRGGDGWTLVDAGTTGAGQGLVDALHHLGVRRGALERIVLTHGHLDHAGGAARVRDAFGVEEVLAGDADRGSVARGENPPGGLPARLARLPVDVVSYTPVEEVTSVPGEIVLDDDRRLVPVPTPGHTPGHVAYHLPEQDVVCGGDVVFNVFRLRKAPGFLCSDGPRNEVSILTVAELAPATLALAHGGPVIGDVAGRLREAVLG